MRFGKLKLSLGGGGGGGGSFSSPEDLFGGTYTEGYWPTNGDSSMYTDATKLDLVDTDNDLVRVVTSTGGGPDAVSSADATRTNWNEASGLLSFGGSDNLDVALTTRGADMYFAAVIETTDPTHIPLYTTSSSTHYAFYCQSGSGTSPSGNAGTPTYLIDGVEQVSPTRDTLSAALVASSGSRKIIEIYNLDLTSASWAGLRLGQGFTGLYGHFTLMENPGADGRASVRAFLAAI